MTAYKTRKKGKEKKRKKRKKGENSANLIPEFPYKHFSFSQLLLVCTSLKHNVFPETPRTDLSIGGFSLEKTPAPLICFCERKSRRKKEVDLSL